MRRWQGWWLPAVFVLVSVGVLIASAAWRWRPGIVLGVVLLFGSSIWWQLRLRDHPATRRERWRRLIPPGLLCLLGVGLMLARPLLGRTEGLGFIGFCLLFLGIGQLLIELRSPAWGPLRPGLLIVGLCAAAFLAGLVGITTGFSGWAVIAMAAGVLVSPSVSAWSPRAWPAGVTPTAGPAVHAWWRPLSGPAWWWRGPGGWLARRLSTSATR